MHVNALSLWATHWLVDWQNWGVIAQVAVAIGTVIFVHELGHFLVAKACGVKCEKFYLGFDIFGLKLAHFRWGETEYGIGILPLGGYVKMLGQEDNPTKAAEEMQRAKIARDAADGDVLPEGVAAAETSIFDPRSYLAQSVPKRMAIISAGVIMNVIFAFVVAVLAYERGVKEMPCIVGGVLPGDPAWAAGLRPGDEIVRIGNIENPRFRDLQSSVILGDNIDQGIKFYVRREAGKEPELVTIHPETSGLAPRIGIINTHNTTLGKPPLSIFAPLGEPKTDPFRPGDVVVAIGGEKVASDADVQRQFAQHRGPITVTVERTVEENPQAKKQDKNEPPKTEPMTIDVPGRPLKRLGMVMEPGPIVAVQVGSAAAEAGLKKGDKLISIDGQPLGDPETLDGRLLARVGETVKVSIEREGQTRDESVTLRAPHDVEWAVAERQPMIITTMGVGIEITNQVASVDPGGPAEKAGIKAGDEVVSALLPKFTIDLGDGDELKAIEREVLFVPKKPTDPARTNWPLFAHLLQSTPADTVVELTLKGDRKVNVAIENSDQWFPDRGFQFEQVFLERRAESFGEALSLGATETFNSVAQVFRFLRKIGTQVSPKGMAGPLGIFGAAHQSASQGLSNLMMFLVMFSANLAVLNFLPIPLLDGGHMVFLALEGIRGKPVSERVVVAFHYVGFLFLISLMAFVFLLDLHVIPRTS